MRILSHYFVARFLGLFSTVLVAAFLILATIELVLNLDDLSAFGSATPGSEGAALVDVFRSLWVRLVSYYLADLIPLASFIATFVTFAWAGRSMEILAVQTGGVRLPRIILPVLAAALILSFATAILHETLILHARQIWSSEAQGSRNPLDFGRKAFWYHKGRTITNISSADSETRTLHGVELFERGPSGTIIRFIHVNRVQISSDGVWQLENASIWNFDPDDPAAQPEFEENISMALDLDTQRGDALLGADPGILSLPLLSEYLDANPSESSSNLRRLRNLYHIRLSHPWLVVVFSFLALPFALRIDQRGLFGGPTFAAVATLGVFSLIQSAGITMSQQELLPAGLTPWLAMGLTLLATAIALRRQTF